MTPTDANIVRDMKYLKGMSIRRNLQEEEQDNVLEHYLNHLSQRTEQGRDTEGEKHSDPHHGNYWNKELPTIVRDNIIYLIS